MDSTGIPRPDSAISTTEVETMMAIVAMLLVSVVFVGPLMWRVWLDRRQAEADMVGADIRTTMNRRLRGESLVAVRVTAPSWWRPGRAVLSVPAGYESLVQAVWPGVARRLPSGYELVFVAAWRRPAPTPRTAAGLPRAA
jgi:hypothetical protein